MKKTVTIFSVIITSFFSYAQAQTSHGNIMLGGDFSITSSKQETGGEDIKTTTFEFSPSAGYFVIDNLAVGLDLSFSSETQEDDKESSFLVGPFARYYKFTSNEKFAFYGQTGFMFGSLKDEPDGADETKGSLFNFYISPGFSYFFNEKWALDLRLQGISYTSYDPNKDNDDDKRSEFTFGVEFFNPSLGFRYYIGQ
jgi:hypothetical protein